MDNSQWEQLEGVMRELELRQGCKDRWEEVSEAQRAGNNRNWGLT